MLAVVVLLQFIQNSSHDIYSSFSGNLDYSWNRELQHICGDRFLPEKPKFRSLGGERVQNREYPWTLGLIIGEYWNLFGAPICMPDANETIPKSLRAAGFGRNPKFHGKRYLQVVNLTLLLNYSEEIVTCSPGYTICAGDSGGPLFKTNETRYTLLGVASRGVKCEKDEDENVSFFEDVRPKLEWICKNSGICPMGFSTKPKAG